MTGRTAPGLVSPTAALRRQYRAAVTSWCYTRSDVNRGLVAGEAATHADIEDQASKEATRWWVAQAAPRHPEADSGWPGAWMDRYYATRAILYIPGTSCPHPPVWRTEGEALAAGVDVWNLVWTPMCRIGTPVGWLLLDDEFWDQLGADILIAGVDTGDD